MIENYTQTKPSEGLAKGKTKHLMYCPFTGLGLYGGFRGNRWLKNRIKIFKQFVIPSLQAQTCKDFTLWVSWRPEEKHNSYVKSFVAYLKNIKEFDTVHTYTGLCFYDDKYPEKVAQERLLMAIHGAMIELVNITEGEYGYEWVLMTIQPSDDCYHSKAVEEIQAVFRNTELQAIGFKRGYLMNYQTKEVAEWNSETNPPFYTIKFPRPVFIDPLKHAQHTALKQDVGKYKKGTPLPSHEYVKDCLDYGVFEERGFLVGTHGENISTVFNHPYKGAIVNDVLSQFGLENVEPLKIKYSLRKRFLRSLPHRVQRKLRYVFGEKGWARIYNFLRN